MDWEIIDLDLKQHAKDSCGTRQRNHPAAHDAQELGVAVVAANIVDNRFRWGSCTTKDHVNFNWRLIKAPIAASLAVSSGARWPQRLA